MGDIVTDEDKAVRERKAVQELTERLIAAYSEQYAPERIRTAVDNALRGFDGHGVRDFVPILVERIARRELDGPPDIPENGTADIDSNASPSPFARIADVAKRFVAPPWTARKLAIPLGVLVVVIALVVVIETSGSTTRPAATALTTVRGVVGSEKLAFFSDPKVADVLARNGIKAEVEPAGSRQIATGVDLGKYDFAFPSSEPAAERILRQRNLTAKYTPFSSPMAIATFRPIADLLTQAGIVHPGPVTTFDMGRYLELTQRGTQWNQLDGNTAYPVDKGVLIGTTDPRTSNSAAMYLAVASYVANDNSIVRGQTAEDFVLSKVARLFTRQGYTDNSSEGPFSQYLSAGMGPTPLVWIYEAQYVEAAVAGKVRPDMVLMYPTPTVLSRHTLVPLNSSGDRIGRLLSTDPQLQELAAEHGFRTNDPAQLPKVAAAHQVPVSGDLGYVVDAPAYDTLEYLLDGVAKSYN